MDTSPVQSPTPIVTGPREFEFADRDFRRVCDLIYQRVGIALAPAKRDMVYGRLSRRTACGSPCAMGPLWPRHVPRTPVTG